MGTSSARCPPERRVRQFALRPLHESLENPERGFEVIGLALCALAEL